MSVAGGCIRYVRIFDLPPELSDLDVSLILGKYGTVKRMVREKFPAELELDLFTGVRGVYMDIKKEIPASLYFLHRRGRIYYDGLKQRCYLCKQEGHLKAICPQNAARRETDVKTEDQVLRPRPEMAALVQSTYSGVVAGTTTSAKTNDELQLSMVRLVSSNIARSSREIEDADDFIIEVLDEESVDAAASVVAQATESASESNDEEMGRSKKRPLVTSSKSESEEADEKYTTVDRSRKTRKQKRADVVERPDVLQTIAAESRGGSKSRGSKSKGSCGDRSRSRSKADMSTDDVAAGKS